MLQAVEGIYRNGTIELLETPENILEILEHVPEGVISVLCSPLPTKEIPEVESLTVRVETGVLVLFLFVAGHSRLVVSLPSLFVGKDCIRFI